MSGERSSAPIGAPWTHGPGAPPVVPGSHAAILFDMDGLLIDSEPLWVDAERILLERHGGTHTEADALETHGRSVAESVAVYARRLGREHAHAALQAELLEIMRDLYSAGPGVRRGARELVHALRGLVPLAVASNTPAWLVRVALGGAGLLDCFTVVASGADLGRGKPFPDVWLDACRRLGVEPGSCLAFEDSPTGVRSAVAAGLTVIGVPDRADVDLAAEGAALVLASLADVVVSPPAG